MKTARWKKNVSISDNGECRMALYHIVCDEPKVPPSYYVIVSSVNTPLIYETYIFMSDEHGVVATWRELTGSRKNTTDHVLVLQEHGCQKIYV